MINFYEENDKIIQHLKDNISFNLHSDFILRMIKELDIDLEGFVSIQEHDDTIKYIKDQIDAIDFDDDINEIKNDLEDINYEI